MCFTLIVLDWIFPGCVDAIVAAVGKRRGRLFFYYANTTPIGLDTYNRPMATSRPGEAISIRTMAIQSVALNRPKRIEDRPGHHQLSRLHSRRLGPWAIQTQIGSSQKSQCRLDPFDVLPRANGEAAKAEKA
ncbi:hypothetical protein F4820DRAFT_422254 [Hypoxylon rubiginosum]|uniref:Uncharacterized protein n=1 Tax=Hypoxylon rubiginosum TaxID=110542 RepID=A0ACB9Z016_9PEZI|nr:hypothetical protein F4820DRAFT_422254 [Hypoxylon rubiginosum]